MKPRSLVFLLCCLALAAWLGENTVDAYKLNVPKVLLPFQSSKLVSFVLEAKSETDSVQDLCFVWSSSRPDIVTITPIYERGASQERLRENGGCSTRALVSAISKHPQRLTSIILARETKTDKIIRCDVIVDQIHAIRIKHTTTQLFLEDSPEAFTVEALDAEGNTFSSLEGLPFEWSILNDAGDRSALNVSDEAFSGGERLAASQDSRNVLRISKFIHSEYETSDTIKQLEKVGLSGHKILIEGLKTGTSNVQAKLIDPFYKEKLRTPSVRLLVVANILLEPSYPIYLLVGGKIKYNVFLIKQTSIEKINLPSAQYYFESKQAGVANIIQSEPTGSTIEGLTLGSTEIVLIDRNMKNEFSLMQDMSARAGSDQKIVATPPTALVHVVHPDHLEFAIKTNGNWQDQRSSWILEVGRTYEIMVLVYTDKRQQIYPSENARIESLFDPAKFKVDHRSANGSYLIVTTLERGLTQAKASLTGTVSPSTQQLVEFEYVARGEQDIELLDPITVTPKVLIFALTPVPAPAKSLVDDWTQTGLYEYRLRASGGSGSCDWKSRNTTIASVSSRSCECGSCSIRTTATRIGHTSILVSDTRNMDIQAQAQVFVLEPVDLQLLACPVETQSGSRLYINIQMNALRDELLWLQDPANPAIAAGSSSLLPINDCSRLSFEVFIEDESLFKFVAVRSPSSVSAEASGHPIEDACAVVVLNALAVGRTSIRVVASVRPEAETSAALKMESNSLLVGSYAPLRSYKSVLTLARHSSSNLHVYDGPLHSSISVQKNPVDFTQTAFYESQVVVSSGALVDVRSADFDYQPNRYTYHVSCLDYSDAEVGVRFIITHRRSQANKCPIRFEHEIKVRCARPHRVQLKQLFVNNDGWDSADGLVPANFKATCPIKLSANVAMAHYQRPLFVHVDVRDARGHRFDNFTSLRLDWKIEDTKYAQISSAQPRTESVEAAFSSQENALVVLADEDETANSHRLFYQVFDVRSKFGRTSLTATLHDGPVDSDAAAAAAGISNSLLVNFVSDVTIKPEALVIFNHPSNVESLQLAHGSGYYHAEVEVIRYAQQLEAETLRQSAAAAANSSLIRINQVSDQHILVSPLANGLVHLNVFDFCIPPPMPFLPFKKPTRQHAIVWSPATAARIEIAGINSIFVSYEDDKVQVLHKIKVFVQISDSTGNLIQTKYFPLMNLRAKMVPVAGENSGSGQAGAEQAAGVKTTGEKLAAIELASPEDQLTTKLDKADKEFTAIYVLDAFQVGTLTLQFEAEPEGTSAAADSAAVDKKQRTTIRSTPKDIQIYSPLSVQPKYIELIVGATYQIVTSGGPSSPDAVVQYERLPVRDDEEGRKKARGKNDKPIIEVSPLGVISAAHVGEIKVLAKSVGESCLPFSHLSSSISSALRCSSENSVQRVYSKDELIVKVVLLRSVHIHAPIKSILRGNEMPVYLLGNEHSLNPLNFGSSPLLKYTWKLNDMQIGSLQHSLLASDELVDAAGPDPMALFESAFSLRFLAHKTGTVRLSVRVELRSGGPSAAQVFAGQQTALTDSIDISVLEEAFFTHFPLGYYAFKYKWPRSQLKLIEHHNFNIRQYQTLLMTPGSSFQIQTNLDKAATKIDYQLAYFSVPESDVEAKSGAGSRLCGNGTIRVSKEGLIEIERIPQSQLKQFRQCVATLLVTTVHDKQDAARQGAKVQSFACTIKVKPVTYAMVKVKKGSVKVNTPFEKIQVRPQSLAANKMAVSDSGIQMKWTVLYYDDLGTMFDIVSLNTEYLVSRADLADISQLNANLFVRNRDDDLNSHSRLGQLAEQAKDAAAASSSVGGKKKPASLMSFVANSLEHSFSLKTLKPGRLVLSFTPLAANFEQARDFLGLSIAEHAGYKDQDLESYSHVDAFVGDLICLGKRPSKETGQAERDSDAVDDDEADGQAAGAVETWSTETPGVVRLMNSEGLVEATYAICLAEGHSVLRKAGEFSQSTPSKIVDINVKPIEKVRFQVAGLKYVTNAVVEPDQSVRHATVVIPFKIGSYGNGQDNKAGGAIANRVGQQNCSSELESLFRSRIISPEILPFKCFASLYSESGRKLGFLGRLFQTSVTYVDNNWACLVTFSASSSHLLYDLVDANTDGAPAKEGEPGRSDARDLEPVSVNVLVESKNYDDSRFYDDENGVEVAKSTRLSFYPSFYVKTKQIEITILRNNLYAYNRQASHQFKYKVQSLVVMATRQLQSHLVVSTNGPAFIQINKPKPHAESVTASSATTHVDSQTLVFDVSTPEEQFDLTAYAALLQQQAGSLYIQISCPLTKQTEQVPVKFIFVNSDAPARAYEPAPTSGSGFVAKIFEPLFDLTSNQITSFLIIIAIGLLTFIYFLRAKSSSQRAAEQIALNASAAAAAVVAANSYHASVRDHSSFNPYRYAMSPSDNSYLISPTSAAQSDRSYYSPLNATRNVQKSPQKLFNSSVISSGGDLLSQSSSSPSKTGRGHSPGPGFTSTVGPIYSSNRSPQPVELRERVLLFSQPNTTTSGYQAPGGSPRLGQRPFDNWNN